MAKWGAEVVIASRDEAASEKTVTDIRGVTGNPHVSWIHLDVSSIQNVRDFAKSWGDRRLDVLVNNAGIAFACGQSRDGFDPTFATNLIGPFLLSSLLLPNLIQAKGRVVNVSSCMHCWTPDRVTWDDYVQMPNILDHQSSWKERIETYGVTKLGLHLVTQEMQRRVEGRGVTVCSVHPGIVQTNLLRYTPHLVRRVSSVVFRFIFKSAAGGCQTLLYCIGTASVISGGYYQEGKVARPTRQARDKAEAVTLWKMLERVCCQCDASLAASFPLPPSRPSSLPSSP